MEQEVTLSEQIEIETQKLKSVIRSAVSDFTDSTGMFVAKIETEILKHSTRCGENMYYGNGITITIEK